MPKQSELWRGAQHMRDVADKHYQPIPERLTVTSIKDGVEVADFVGVELEEIEGTSDAVFESLEPQAASVEAAATAAAAAIVREVVRVVENVIMLRCRRSLTGGAQSTEGSVRSARLRPALQPVDHEVEGTSV